MADPKDGESFFRKVVRFVANPATDWSDVTARNDDEQDLERSELKAMVERKRRNDFVRKREFDTLRRLRRDGLTSEQLATLGGSSKVDDSEVRLADNSVSARADSGVKAKIDEIELQMVGDPTKQARDPAARRPASAAARPMPPVAQRPTDFYMAPTEPVSFDPGQASRAPMPASSGARPSPPKGAPPLVAASAAPVTPPPPTSAWGQGPGSLAEDDGPTLRLPSYGYDARSGGNSTSKNPSNNHSSLARPSAGQAGAAAGVPAEHRPGAGLPQADTSFSASSRFAVAVNEVVHDAELDEAVIAFANADFNQCEQALNALCKVGAPRHRHADTWHVLLDLYRATGQQAKFEALSLDYAHQFGRSSPQWYSLPKRLADATADARPDTRGVKGDVGWISPAQLDVDAVTKLRSVTLQLPLPWVLDWSALQRVDVEAASQLQSLFRQWAPQVIDMRWLGADRLLTALQEAAPTGVRDADPAFWMARLEALRLANRPDQFDETAIDYCVTYEVSPPSWEKARCQVRISGGGNNTSVPPLSIIGEVASRFFESGIMDDGQAGGQVTMVDLSGQLAGDISATLQEIDRRLGPAKLVQVSCARLIRVDFIAAGDLLNWVLAKRTEHRHVTFIDAHRLVALFFGAMGINEQAKVLVPRD